MLKVNEKLIEIDSEGYLINPEEWNKEVAIELAKSEDIELSDDYWAIFDFMQSYYKEHGIVPDIRHTAKNFGEHLGVDKKSNLVLAELRLGLKNRQVGEKWVSDDCSYLCKGLF
jgi:tRNA 2-thiouridine synthesizing protein E